MDAARIPAPGSELQHTLELLHRLFVEVDAARERLPSHPRILDLLSELRHQPHLGDMPKALLGMSRELAEALHNIRHTRETIQSYSVQRLRDTHARLDEVSSATETAAMEMLNGLDRALATIDGMERAGGEGEGLHAHCDALRNEVNQLYGALQFQDIITQQLRGVAGMLVEVEQRLEAAAGLFDGRARSGGDPLPVDAESYNALATMHDPAGRQAVIDAAFSAARSPARPR